MWELRPDPNGKYPRLVHVGYRPARDVKVTITGMTNDQEPTLVPCWSPNAGQTVPVSAAFGTPSPLVVVEWKSVFGWRRQHEFPL